ncbi:unnamed protein product [Ixodes hexagonus]
MRDPRRLVVAISESGSCCSFSLTANTSRQHSLMALVWSGFRMPVALSR